MFLQTLITGLAIGGIYALMAVGYSLVFSILNFSNFAYGAIIMLGSYIGYYTLVKFGTPFALALIIAMLGAVILSFLHERIAFALFTFRPLWLRSSILSHLPVFFFFPPFHKIPFFVLFD